MGDRPLSTVQSGVWFAQQLDPANPAFNIGGYTDIDGAVDPVQFQAALRLTVLETEALHVRFVVDHEGVPAQVRTPPPDWPMRYVDVSGEADPEQAAAGWMADDMATPVELTRDPLFAHALLKLAPDRYFWYFRCHHIVLDGWGIWLFASRVAEIYTANSTGQPLPPGLPAALDRIAEEDAAYRRSARFADDRAYWIERLAGRPPAVGLAGRAAPAGHRFHRHTGYLPESLVDALGDVARSTAATWPSVVVAAVAGYVRRHTNAPEVVLGFPVSGRWGAAAKRTPSMMSTILPLRLAAPDGVRFGDLVRAASQEMRQTLRHQRYTAEDLRRDLRLVGRTGALSAVSVNIMPFDYRLTFGSCPSVMHMLSSGPVEDLAISVHAQGSDGRVRIDVDGNPALYEAGDLRTIHERVVRVLELGCADPDATLDDHELLDDAERRRVLVDFNDTTHPVPDTTLTALLEAQARTSPAATALVVEGVEVSYAELHRRANRMARELIRHGAGPGTLVAVAVPRSVELMVSLLAVLKTGAAYLPLDPDYPVDRLDFMLRDARPVLVATVREVLGALPVDAPVLVLDEPGTAAALAARDGTALGAADRVGTADPRDPAYVIYTSGSTGVPKGVVVPHRGIVNRLLWMQHRYGLTPQDRVLQKTPASFDVSVWEFFWPLLTGATLVLARPGGHKDPRYLAELIRTERVSTVHFVPSMLREFLSEPDATGCRGLRRVICSGEALPAELTARFFEVLDTELHNLYGPTEASVDVTAWECRPEPGAVVPIGRPVWNTRMYVLDRQHRPVPVGVVGELYIAGVQLADGYLGRPDLTAERFVPDPYGEPGAVMYRTGDLASWRADGVLLFAGRVDDQVKIRGNRIELAEIESVLARHPGVAQATIAARTDGSGDQRLVAYVVTVPDGPPVDAAVLRKHTAALLPDYMVPTAFVPLATLPLTPTGKVDRRALPDPPLADRGTGRAPRTPGEVVLAGLFAEVLDLPLVGVDESFFELGGHSLAAARLVRRIGAFFGVDLDVRDIFATPTVAELAARLDGQDDGGHHIGQRALDVVLPLRAHGTRQPLFFFHPIGGLSWPYSVLLRYLDTGHPVYGLQSRGLGGPAPLAGSIEEMAADYADEIQRVQPTGPYHLLGWSLGGILAHTVAAELQTRGAEVALLALLDCYPSDPSLHGPVEYRRVIDIVLADFGYDPAILDGAGVEDAEVLAAVRRSGGALVDWDDRAVIALMRVAENNLALFRGFTPRRYRGDVLFLTATLTQPEIRQTVDTWLPYIDGRIDNHEVVCRHELMMRPAHVADVGQVLAAHLRGYPSLCADAETPYREPAMAGT